MGHEKYTRQVTELALGGPAPPALEAHLRRCAECQALLAAERDAARERDTEIASLVGADVPPDLAGRIARRVAAEARAAERRSGLSGAWFPRVLLRPAWALAGLLLLVGLPLLLLTPGRPPRIAPSADAPGPRNLAIPVVAAEARLEGYQPLEKMRIVVLPRVERP